MAVTLFVLRQGRYLFNCELLLGRGVYTNTSLFGEFTLKERKE